MDPEVVRRLRDEMDCPLPGRALVKIEHLSALLADWERQGEAITGLRAAHHSGSVEEWEAAVRFALEGRNG